MTMSRVLFSIPMLLLLSNLIPPSLRAGEDPDIALFQLAGLGEESASKQAYEQLAPHWRNGYTVMFVEMARLLPAAPRYKRALEVNPAGGGSGALAFQDQIRQWRLSPRGAARARITAFLEEHTGQKFGDDLQAWRLWMWSLDEPMHQDYLTFKRWYYSLIDPRMQAFFQDGSPHLIRLDEIDWGGVKVNGIPPLDHAAREPAAKAKWLKGNHVVFGIVHNGEALAFPKRILAWHEMARDTIGGQAIALVYCTLCGTAIPYKADVAGNTLTFGTSGLLYRSNKLMFDEETNTLWSTLEGKPVLGPLVPQNLHLDSLPIVTTTWKEWKNRYPDTQVISLETGYERDYGEGIAYADYFKNDDLMFLVPSTDDRLKNKDEILALKIPTQAKPGGRPFIPVAVSSKFLQKHKLFSLHDRGWPYLIITDDSGAHRVYETPNSTFSHHKKGLVDAQNRIWTITAPGLVPESGGETLPRVPAFRAFWFGWQAQYPDTVLIR